MRNLFLLPLLFSIGCGGSEFTTGLGGAIDGDAGDAHVEQTSTGGASSSGGSGGATGSIGGMASAGGTDSGDATTISSGGTIDAADACVMVTHSTGLGQTWRDCMPLETCNQNQALRACLAYCEINGGCRCATATAPATNCGPGIFTTVVDGGYVMWKSGHEYINSGGDLIDAGCHVYSGSINGSLDECIGIGSWN